MAKETGKKVLGIVGIASAVVALIMSAAALAKTNDQETKKDLGLLNYQVATVNDNGTIDTDGETSIVSDRVSVAGAEIDFKNEESRVTVYAHYYDEDKKYVSKSEEITADYVLEAPEGAEYVRFEVVPNEGEDEDGKISYFEMVEYLGELNISIDKAA